MFGWRRAFVAVVAIALTLPAGASPVHKAKAKLPSFTFGERAHAQAGVVADILDQRYTRLIDDANGSILFDGKFRISLRVKWVLFGPIVPGEMAVNAFMHTDLNTESTNNRFYLTKGEDGEWWIAGHP